MLKMLENLCPCVAIQWLNASVALLTVAVSLVTLKTLETVPKLMLPGNLDPHL